MKNSKELNEELGKLIQEYENPKLPESPFKGDEDDEWNKQKERDNQVDTDEDKQSLSGTVA